MAPETPAAPAALAGDDSRVVRPASAMENVEAAETLLGYVYAALGSQLPPNLAEQYGEYLRSVTDRLKAARAQMQHEGRRVEALAGLLNAGGLEFVPTGTTAHHKALLTRAVTALYGDLEVTAEAELLGEISRAVKGPGANEAPEAAPEPVR